MPLWGAAQGSASTNKPKFLPQDENSIITEDCYATQAGWVMEAGTAMLRK